MSVEGGMKGTQRRFVCGNCGKVFFAWRPDTHPAVKVKCYFCKYEFEDEAAKRGTAAAPTPATSSEPSPTKPAAESPG